MQQEDRRKCITVDGRTKKTQSILWVWPFFRFYVEKPFSVWDKPWSHATKVVKWGSKPKKTWVFDVTISTIWNCLHSSTNNFFATIRDTSNVCRKKGKYLLPTKHSPNVVSDREFRGWFIFSILITYLKCHATNYHKH